MNMDDNSGGGESERERRRRILRQQRDREDRAYDREQRRREHEQRQRDIRLFNLADQLLQETWDPELTELVRQELVNLQEQEEFNDPVLLLLDQIQPNAEENREEFDNVISNGEVFLYTIISSNYTDQTRLTSAFRGNDWPETGLPWVEVVGFRRTERDITVPFIINEANMPGADDDDIERFQWLNRLSQVTRLIGPDDIYAFNMFVQLNLNPDLHWATNDSIDPLNRFRID